MASPFASSSPSRLGPFDNLVLNLRHDPKAIVLLGAGCSIQYGLPPFDVLLHRVRCQLAIEREGASPGGAPPPVAELEPDLDRLRRELSLFWEGADIEERRRYLRPHLSAVDGRDCLGFRYLARLATQYFRCIVTMNFDTLLEDACDAEGRAYCVTSSFLAAKQMLDEPESSPPAPLVIVKPHGSLSSKRGLDQPESAADLSPIIELDKTNMFNDANQRQAAEELFMTHQVLTLGYSGDDYKMAAVLGYGKRQNELDTHHLFFINPEAPRPNIQPALAARRSGGFQILGPEGRFGPFMSRLYRALGAMTEPTSQPVRYGPSPPPAMDESEDGPLEACKRLALRIRGRMNVAEIADLRLEEHADEVFLTVLQLSTACGVALTQAERFVLRAATFFHDLGYFWSGSSGSTDRRSGLSLLASHGAGSEKVVSRFLVQHDQAALIPETHDEPGSTLSAILELCRLHSEPFGGDGDPRTILIDGVGIAYRTALLQALFQVAEELLGGHPRVRGGPSLVNEGYLSLNDPILELHLYQSQAIKFKIYASPPLIVIRNSAEELHELEWSLFRIRRAVQNLNSASQNRDRPLCIHVFAGSGNPGREEDRTENKVVTEALSFHLDFSVAQEMARAPGGALAALDLVSLYTMQSPSGGQEPRLKLEDVAGPEGPLTKALNAIGEEPSNAARDTALYRYFCESIREPDAFSGWYREYFALLHPAWRFLARSWRLGISPMDFAPTILACGSSRIRPEVALGIRSLVHERLFTCSSVEDSYYGHQGCMQCTGLATQTLARTRQRLASEDIARVEPLLEPHLAGILRFLLRAEIADLDWMGLHDQRQARLDERIISPSYLSQVIVGLVDVLQMDKHLALVEKESFLKRSGIAGDEIVELLGRLHRLLNDPAGWGADASRFEESSTAWGSAVAKACLALRSLETAGGPLAEVSESLRDLLEERTAGQSDVQRFRSIPILTLFADLRRSQDAQERVLREVQACIRSAIWIRQPGEGYGSWGYNANTTDSLVSALLSFWRFACDHREGLVAGFRKLSQLEELPPEERH